MKKDNLKILILIGIPASGKSTWSKDFIRNNEKWVRVNRDHFRKMLKNSQMCDPKIEDMITGLVNKTIHSCLAKKLNVIVDNTNLKVKYINAFIEEFKHSADIDYRVFDISLDKAIERDENREDKVGENVIKKLHKDYKVLVDSFNFQPINQTIYPEFILPNKTQNNQGIIVDLDGTLSIISKRNPFDFNKVMNDKCNWLIKEQIEFHKKMNRTIIICSGRSDICKEETEMWLSHYNIPYDLLLMRKEGDYRKDVIIKKELYDNFIKNNHHIISVYDDRPSVVDGWKEMGLFVFDVNHGSKYF
jgi:predicted kinase